MSAISDNKIKLALFTPSTTAASETFIRAHIERIDAKTTVFSNGGMPTEMHGIPMDRFLFRLIDYCKRLLKTQKYGSYDEFVLASNMKKQGIEVALAEYGPTGAAVLDACNSLAIPLIVYFHGYDSSVRYVIESHGNYSKLLKGAARVFVVSNDMKERLINLGAPEDIIILNPCTPNEEFFETTLNNEGSQTFVSAGRFVNKKAPHLTLLAFSKLATKYPDARLIMLGDGELHQVCRDFARELQLEDRVELPGVYSRPELIEHLSKACAFVQHSVTAENGDKEGTPVSILEASAAGLPVVSTRHAGITNSVLDGITGYLVDEYDVDGMSQAMTRTLDDPLSASRMGAEGKNHVKNHYSMKDHIEAIDNAIQDVVRKKD